MSKRYDMSALYGENYGHTADEWKTMTRWPSEATTLVPPSYPALEAEVYASLDFATERETMVPAADEQLGLEADCFVGVGEVK